jgi:transmembrane sensor
MTDQQVNDLLKRYRQGKCTPEERLWVDSWNYERYTNMGDFNPEADYDQVSQRTWERLQNLQQDGRTRKTLRSYRYWPVAAAIILLFATSYLYFIYDRPDKHLDLYSYNKAHDIPAGGNMAILTLANGKQIELDSMANGTIISQGGVTVTKNKNGLIVYTAPLDLSGRGDADRPGKVSFNTISTPNGGQYEVILPDCSKVVLNAASSLKYPTSFNSKERKVELTGEAYFEISKNPEKPFIVSSDKQTVKVLGTHFNISNYPNEGPAKTTLAEGSVLVTLELNRGLSSPSSDHQILKPGQQAVNTGNAIQVKTINVDDEIAWKDGLFVFNQTSFKDVLQQISRWYNVEVDYNSLPDLRFDGTISRDFPLSELLKAIEKTNHVKYKIEGRKIILIK